MSPRNRNVHRDPDVVALIEAGGGLVDPKTLVINQARQLNSFYRNFESTASTPLERLIHLASLKGFGVNKMQLDNPFGTQREAVVMMTDSATGKGGQIFYNPLLPEGRIAFSIAHEIAHTFFPSTNRGARFREMSGDDSHKMSELELLCHAGAAELLMPIEEFRAAVSEWSISSAIALASRFGSSFEATVFRLASAYPGVAAAGLACYRRTVEDERKLKTMKNCKQRDFFEEEKQTEVTVGIPKYRRQSFHFSESFPERATVRWNKSFDFGSALYAVTCDQIARRRECLPADLKLFGKMEAVDAPYQRDGADPDHPDVLFYWRAA